MAAFTTNLQRLREKSDYNCFFDVSEKDIETFPLASNKREAVPIDVGPASRFCFSHLLQLYSFFFISASTTKISPSWSRRTFRGTKSQTV